MELLFIVISVSAVFGIWFSVLHMGSTLWKILHRRRTSEKRIKKFAVFIPTYNDYAGPAVRSCLNAKYPKDMIRMYILDDSDDEEIIERNKKLVSENVIWVRRKERRKGYKAGALNYGLNLLQDEEYVVVLDADGEIERDFFLKLSEKFDTWEIDAIQAKWINNQKHTVLSYYAWIYAGTFHNLFVPVLNFIKSALILGNGFAIKRNVLEKVKFNERFVAEDFKLALDCIEKGYKIMFFDDIHVRVTQPKDLRNIDRQFTRWAFGGSQVIFEHILGKKPNLASVIILSLWISTIVVIPLTIMTTYYIIITMGVLKNLEFLTMVYLAGILPLATTTVYYLSKDHPEIPLIKKVLAQLLCSHVGYFFHIKGLFKYALTRRIEWIPTEKVV